ncbi:MAG: NTP transferase domain-containing protein [Candidatus Binataceae bacterium]|jgi:NDP-sugar pyrophosphorylase family protein
MVARFEGAIIAAGHGERLRAGGQALPKPLVEIAGQPMLIRQARALIAAGAERVLAVINSETERLRAANAIAIPDGLMLSVRDTPNSMETLFALGERLAPGYFLLTTVDAVTAPGELERFASGAFAIVESEPALDGVLGVVRWRGDHRPLFVSVSNSGLIESFGDERASMVTAGVYVFSTRIFDFAARARESGCGALRQFLSYLVANGRRLKAIELGETIDIDEAADLEAARAMVEGENRRQGAPAPRSGR